MQLRKAILPCGPDRCLPRMLLEYTGCVGVHKTSPSKGQQILVQLENPIGKNDGTGILTVPSKVTQKSIENNGGEESDDDDLDC